MTLKLTNQDSLNLIVENNAKIKYNSFDSVKIKKLNIQISGNSTFNYSKLQSDKIVANIVNGAFYYNSNLRADSLIVNLSGKSVVKSEDIEKVQQVKNLVITGNKQYYKDWFSGRNTNVIFK